MTPCVWWKLKGQGDNLPSLNASFLWHDIKWVIKLSDDRLINALYKKKCYFREWIFPLEMWMFRMNAWGKTKSTDSASVIAQILVQVRAPSGVPITSVTLPIIALLLSKALTELDIHLGRSFPEKLRERNTIAWASCKSFTWVQSPGSSSFQSSVTRGNSGPPDIL